MVDRRELGMQVSIEPEGIYVSQFWCLHEEAWGWFFALLYQGASGFVLEVDRKLKHDDPSFDRFSVDGDERTALHNVGVVLRSMASTAKPTPTFCAIMVRSSDKAKSDLALALMAGMHFPHEVPIA